MLINAPFKWYAFIALLAFFSISCKVNKKSDFVTYLELKEKATLSTVRTDTTFLKFRFGMSTEQVKNKLEQLEKDSIVYYDYDRKRYCYILNTGRTGSIKEIKCQIIPEFNKDELYSIILLSIDDKSGGLSAGLSTSLMTMALIDKYGSNSAVYKLTDMSETTVWFVNNIEIAVKEMVTGAAITYTDLARQRVMEDEETKVSEKAHEKTKSEL